MVNEVVVPLDGSDRDLDALLDLIGDAPFVLLGEATHGTHREPRFYLPLRRYRPHLEGLPGSMPERAIGVVYKPETELVSQYFRANLLQQFDAVFHYDTTRALERTALWQGGEVPETYPSGV